MEIFETLRKHQGETCLDSLLKSAKKTGIPHVADIDIPIELQESMKCQFGVDLFVDNPWMTVPKDIIIKDIKENKKYSPFYSYAGQINALPDPEIIIGCNGTDHYAPYIYHVAVTSEARKAILQDLKDLHLLLKKLAEKSFAKIAGIWEGFGSEKEIGIDEPKNNRPLISLEYIGRKANRFERREFDIVHPDDPPIMYTSLTGDEEPEEEFVTAVITHKAVQIGANAKVNASVQTAPQIPMNAATQFNPDIDAEEKEKWLQEQGPIDEDLMKESFAKSFERMTTELSYNAEYDLYVDDYEELAKYGQLTDLLPSADYKHHATFFNTVTDKEYFITSTAWSTSYCGTVAVSYGQNVLCKLDELTSDSDDENYKPKPSRPEEYTPKFHRETLVNEVKEAGLWKAQANKIKEFGEEEDMTLYNIAIVSLNFIARALRLREQELLLDREFEENIPELEDFNFVDDFDYEQYNEQEYDREENLLAKFELLPTIAISEDIDPVSFPEKFEDRLKQHTPKDTVSFAQESKSLNILWDIQNWIYGEPLLENALVVHRRHFHEAVKKIGKLQDIPKVRIFIPFFKGKSSWKKKEVRTKKRRRARGKTPNKPYMSKPDPKKTAKKKDVLAEVSDDDYEEEQRIKHIVETEPVNFVLIWSLHNTTEPLIRCDSPYEITSLNFCPHNGDILVGGTILGQVILWDLQGKLLSKKENLPENPLDRQAHKTLKETMAWYRDLKAPRRVKITAISSMEDAHTSKVVHIQWVHPYLEFTNGRFCGVSAENTLSSQFLSTSLDGEIKCWDLKSEPLPKPTYYISQKSVVRRNRFPIPEQLYAERSNYSQLNNRWVSTYTIAPPHKVTGNKSSRGSLLAACIQFSARLYKYERAIPKNPKLVDRLTDTVPYNFSITKNKENTASSRNACVGMMTGNLCLMKWDGQDKSLEPEARIMPEISQAEIFETIHDGPITGVVRHSFIKNIALSVGGHVWAIWNLVDSKWPIKWKRYYGVLVTTCSFSPLRPSLFRIGRSDGNVEIWDLMLMSHEPKIIIPAAGSMVTGFSSHNIPLPKGLLGICDYKASLIFYCIPWVYQLWTKAELEALTSWMMAEPKRKDRLKEWGEAWRRTHPSRRSLSLCDASSESVMGRKLLSVTESGIARGTSTGKGALVTVGQSLMQSELSEEQCKQYFREIYKWYLRRRGNTSRLLTDKDREWYEREEANMIKNLLLNNKIDIKQLQQEMSPLIQDEKKMKEKEVRIKEILSQADAIFKESVAMILGTESGIQAKSPRISPTRTEENTRATFVEAVKDIELVFGHQSEEMERELALSIERALIDRPSVEQLMIQGEEKRELLNDRRLQQGSPTSKRQTRDGLGEHEEDYVEWMSHEEIYKIKKYTERVENLAELKKQYGDGYDPLWDFDGKAYTRDQVPFKLPYEEEEPERDAFTEKTGRYKNRFSALDLDLIAGTEHNPVELLLAQEKHALETSSGRMNKGITAYQRSSSKILSEPSPESLISERLEHSVVPPEELSLLNTVEEIAEAMLFRGEETARGSDESARHDSVIELSQILPAMKRDVVSKGSAESLTDFLDEGDVGEEEEEEHVEEEEQKKKEDDFELYSKSTEEFLHTAKSDSLPADFVPAKETMIPEASPTRPVTLAKPDEPVEIQEDPSEARVLETEPEQQMTKEEISDVPALEERSEREMEEIVEEEQSQDREEVAEVEKVSEEISGFPSEYFEEGREEEILSESMLLGEEILEGESIASPGPSPRSTSSDVSDFIATDESEQELYEEFFAEAAPSRFVPPIIRKPSTLSAEEPTEEYMGDAQVDTAVDEELTDGQDVIPAEAAYRKRISIPEGRRVGSSSSSSSSDDESGSLDRTFSQLLKDRAAIESERQRQLKDMDKTARQSLESDK